MYFEGQVSEHFSGFSTIFETITSNEYSDEQKEEMMKLLKAQTVDKHLSLVKRFAKVRDDASELSDIVLEVVEERGKGNFRCQEFFLNFFDASLEVHDNSNSNERNVFGDSFDHNSSLRVQPFQEDLQRKNDYLTEENKVLKEELEEKVVLVDDLAEANRNFSNLKTEFCRIDEKFVLLNSENNLLNIQLNKNNDSMEAKEVEWKSKESLLLKEIKELKELVAEKDTLIKLSEREQGFMFTDFELLSEEIVDRDLVIQSLSEASGDNKENDAFFFENVSNSFSNEDPNLSIRKRIVNNSCENCARRRESSVYFSNLNNTVSRRRGTPSPTFDFEDSFSMPEVVDFSQRRTKSLSDELMEVKIDMEEERTTNLREIVGTLFLLEVDLRLSRQNLQKSMKLLLNKNQQKTNTMTRYRMIKGKMSKMQFTKYEGVRLPN